MKQLLSICALMVMFGCGGAGHTDVLRSPDGEIRIAGLGGCGAAPAQLDARPLVVLVHGNKAAHDVFEPLAEALDAAGMQTLCFRWVQRGRLTFAARALAEALAQLDAPRIIVVGHSLGGLAARRAVTRDLLPSHSSQIDLVTASTPFSGVRAASACATVWMRVVSLGTVSTICRRITRGSKWRDIHPDADMIADPGELGDYVRAHLHVVTDERDTCRRTHPDGRCAKSDHVFSMEEQATTWVSDPRMRRVRVAAGHGAIVSDPNAGLLDALRVLVPD